MIERYSNIIPIMDTNDSFVKIGFCPDVVRVTKLSDGQDIVWARVMGADTALERVAAGDRTLTSDKGIKLVQFTEMIGMDESSDPSAVDPVEYYKANGIQITADETFMEDDKLCLVEAWRLNHLWIGPCVHDGTTSSNTYGEDRSFDFLELGVSPNWIVYNQTNGDYAYVKEVIRPMGQTKHCRVYTATDTSGTATTAADFDTADVFYIFPRAAAPYPMSDIGLMT